MTIKFAAVHPLNSWRPVHNHMSLTQAMTGKDGAENLLWNLGRARFKTDLYGFAHAVFVWDADASDAVAFRLRPGSDTEIERVRMPVDVLTRFKRKLGPSEMDIEQWFSTFPPYVPGEEGERWADSKSGTVPKSYRYGSKPAWQIVLDAVRSFGRPVLLAEVGDRISQDIRDFDLGNLAPDLSVLSVNCFSRGNHSVNRRPRRADTGNAYDQLIRLGRGRGVRFDLYDPAVHGVWALVDVGEDKLRPRFLGSSDELSLEGIREVSAAAGLFDITEDARRRTLTLIAQRDGQPAFRKALLAAYEGRCAVTGCAIEELLEAAHIVPYRGSHTNLIGNGLLLRADLHKMFDLHLFRIDPATHTVHLSEALRSSEYACYEGAQLRLPEDESLAPLAEALGHHAQRCGWVNAGPGGAPLNQP